MAKSQNQVYASRVNDDQSASWANSAAANTAVNIDIVKPNETYEKYALSVHNPSTETALTIKVYQKKKSLGGADRYALLTTVNVAVNSTEVSITDKPFLGEDCRFVVSNDTALGLSGAFTANVRLEEIIIGG
jgi:hypothetical protein